MDKTCHPLFLAAPFRDEPLIAGPGPGRALVDNPFLHLPARNSPVLYKFGAMIVSTEPAGAMGGRASYR